MTAWSPGLGTALSRVHRAEESPSAVHAPEGLASGQWASGFDTRRLVDTGQNSTGNPYIPNSAISGISACSYLTDNSTP